MNEAANKRKLMQIEQLLEQYGSELPFYIESALRDVLTSNGPTYKEEGR